MQPFNLRKFCRPEHHIKRCETLRIGTLKGFRKIEDDALRDEGEATGALIVGNIGTLRTGPNRTAHEDAIGRAFGVDTTLKHENIVIQDCEIRWNFANAYVFCFSIDNLENDPKNLTEKYSDHWILEASQFQSFSQFVSRMILDQISLKHLPAELITNFPIKMIVERMGIQCSSRAVEYTDRALNAERQGNLSYESLQDFTNNVPFRKPTKYSGEHEFRFVFNLFFEGRTIEVNDIPIDLKMRQFDLDVVGR